VRVVGHFFAAGALACLLLSGCGGDPASSGGTMDGGGAPPGLSQFNDIPLPAGASFDQEQSLILGSQNEWLGRLVLNTSNTPRSLVEFYSNEMRRFGWAEVTTVRGETSVLTFARGNRVATVQITSRTLRGAQVNVTMSPRGQDSGAPAPGMGSPPASPPSMAVPPPGPVQTVPPR
jgi:hypothetical protein